MDQKEGTGKLTPEQEELLASLRRSVGAPCEVRSAQDVTMCNAYLDEVKGDAIVLKPSGSQEMPSVIYNTTCKLLLRPRKKTPMTLFGTVCGSSPLLWKMDRLRLFPTVENRAYFRQAVFTQANVTCVTGLFSSEQAGAVPPRQRGCTVRNISLGGIQLQSTERFIRNDILMVRGIQIKDNGRLYRLLCQVCWADRVSKEEFLFGCRTFTLSEKEMDDLNEEIFALQRENLNKRKDSSKFSLFR